MLVYLLYQWTQKEYNKRFEFIKIWKKKSLKSYDSNPVGKKTCVVIYKDIVDGFIITALLTSKQEQFVKRGRTIWKK